MPAAILTSSFAPFVRTNEEVVRLGIDTTPELEIENLAVPTLETTLLIRKSWVTPSSWPIAHSHTPPLFDKWYRACPAVVAAIDI